MAKASKGFRTEEYDCCRRTRARVLETVRKNVLSFPFIQNVVCATCKMVLKVRVYNRQELEEV